MCLITVITSLYNSQEYLEGYFEAVGRIENKNEIEVLLIHNAPNDIEMGIINKFLPHLPFVKHVNVSERESLYSSWNRGIKLAKGELIAIWNVDDIRTPDSLILQRDALLNSKAVLCYGDFYGTNKYGQYKDRAYTYKRYEDFRWEAVTIHIVGCFPMWRKEIHQHVGYYDEQFRIVSDYDFQVRVALNYALVKCAGTLGYYLENMGHKLSSNNKLLDRERTVVELRFQLYNRVMLHVLPFIGKLRVNEILNFGKWVPLKQLIPSTRLSVKGITSLVTAPFVYSFLMMKRISIALYNTLSK